VGAFDFESVPAAASLMCAIEVLREANRKGSASLPKSAPTGKLGGQFLVVRGQFPMLLDTPLFSPPDSAGEGPGSQTLYRQWQ